jgi:hypothetical protein
MGDWSLYGSDTNVAAGITAVSNGVSVTCGVTNTKTATAVQLIAQTPFAAVGIYVHFRVRSSASDYLVDILARASGAKQVLLPNLYIGGATNTTGITTYFFPIQVPPKTRLSVKAQSAAASPTITTVVHLVAASFLGDSG